VTFNGTDYSPLPIKRTAWQESRENKSNTITITLPTDDEISANFLGIQPSALMDVQVLRIQAQAVPATASLIMFEGYVASAAFKDQICEFKCVPHNEVFFRTMPRFNYQGLCNHVLYDSRCGVLAGSYKYSGKVLGVTNEVDISIQALPTTGTPFVGGYLQIPDGSEQRLIISQTGTTVKILYPFKQSISGTTVDVYQGCDHTAETCAQKFGNILNYGGFPFVPSVNPFNKQQLTKE
jgi:uncharacterized phage protein (TIGR02218 family)